MGAAETRQFRSDVDALKHNQPTLRELNYEDKQLGDDGANVLAGGLRTNTNLRRIRLGGCGIGPEGLHIFVRSLCEDRLVPSKLRKLELSTSSTPNSQGNPIGDRGAKSLAFLLVSSESLHHLKVASCGIGDDGAVSLAKGLARNGSLKTLDLSNNSISDTGAEELGLALKVNKSLKGLILWHNRIFHTGAEGIANGLASNKTLQWLGLGCNHISDEGAKALALALLSNGQASALVWLALGGNGITDRGVEHFAVALKLQHVSNSEGLSAETASLTEQIRHGKLRPMLDLGVTPSQVSLHVDEPSSKTNLEDPIEENDGITDSSRTYCIPLQSLGLGGNRITCLGAGYIADGLKTNSNLLSLGLADNRISDEGAAFLAELIRCTDTLQTLTLSGNEIHDEGGTVLMASLTQNTSLQALYLAGNPCGDLVSSQCVEVIGRHNHTLQVLDLHDTRMTSPAATSLLDAMRSEKVLRSLGSHPVPIPGTKRHAYMPESGNVLELEVRQPQDVRTRLQKQNNKLSSNTPSHKPTTINMLSSLPEPEETAQTMVIRQSTEFAKASQKRRGSISRYIKKKLSFRKKGKDSSSSLSYHIQPVEEEEEQEPRRKKHRVSRNVGGFEMQPLVEEEADVTLESGQDFTDAGLPGETTMAESSMFTLRQPTVMVESDLGAEELHGRTLAEVEVSFNNTSLDSNPQFPIFSTHEDIITSSTPDHKMKTAGTKKVKSKQLDSAIAMQDPELPSSTQEENIPLSSLSEEVRPTTRTGTGSASGTTNMTSMTTSFMTDHSINSHQDNTSAPSSSSSNVASDIPTTSAHSFPSSTSNTKSPSSSTHATTQAHKSSQKHKSIPASTSSSTSTSPLLISTTTSPPVATSSQQSNIMSSTAPTSVPTSNVTTSTAPMINANDTNNVNSEASSTLPTQSPPPLPSVPTVAIRPTKDASFSGAAGSMPTHSWNAVMAPSNSNSNSLPRNALEEDDVEVVDIDAVPPTESLRSLTSQRPKPPSQRRPPSKKSPSPSPVHAPGTRSSGPTNQVMRIGGITASTILEDRETEIDGDQKSEKSVKSIQNVQEQWVTALRKRLGVLKMGGFLHRGFDAITSADIDKKHDFTAAKLFRNDPKNSLLAPLPPSHTRVKLQLVPDEVGSDYINASYLGPPTAPRQFIVAQSPMVNTVGDFWRMVWECRVGIVVVLTLEEEGTTWWPEEGEKQSYPLVVDREWEEESLIVSNVGEQVNSANPDLVVRSVVMEGVADNETDNVQIFHYTNWPEYGVLSNEQDICSFVRHITRAKFAQKYSNSPVVVVSKQGAGRAGCFCSIFIAHELLTTSNTKLIPEQWKEETNILDQVIRGLRHCRGGLVSSQRQFEFCHRALGELIWGRPVSQEELDTWERVTRKKGKKKWKVFGKKDKNKNKTPNKKKGKSSSKAVPMDPYSLDMDSDFLMNN